MKLEFMKLKFETGLRMSLRGPIGTKQSLVAFILLALLLSACSSLGERDNPTDPEADNYNAAILNGSSAGSLVTSSASEESKSTRKYLNPEITYGEIQDERDGQVYATVSIGSSVWLAENMNLSGFGVCYDDDHSLCRKYGHLYNWYEATEICPEGFHLPTKAEWNEIQGNVALLSLKGWALDDGAVGGTDEYGFALLPGGFGTGNSEDGFSYEGASTDAMLWTATEFKSDSAYGIFVNSTQRETLRHARNSYMAVRCVGDKGTELIIPSSDSSGEDNTDPESSSSDKSKNSSNSSGKNSSSSAGKGKNGIVCGDLWCGARHEYTVNTGYKDGGYWVVYKDDGNGGDSYFEWLAEDVLYPDMSAIIDDCDGVCGTAHMGFSYEFPYVDVGFAIDEGNSPVDISSWDGICVVYDAEQDFYASFQPDEPFQIEMEYDDYVYLMKKGTNVTVDIPWTEFDQAGWGVARDRDEVLSRVAAIVFVFKGYGYGESVSFNIRSVGRLGTCK